MRGFFLAEENCLSEKRLKNAGYADCGNNSRSRSSVARQRRRRGKNPNSGNNGPRLRAMEAR